MPAFTVTELQAKSILSRLVRAVVTGNKREIIITRSGHSVARLVPVEAPAAGPRPGIAEGLLGVPEDINIRNDEVEVLFRGKAEP